MKTNKYIGYQFESDTVKTPEFKAFSRDFKIDLKKMVGNDFELIDYSTGHFFVSGFLKSKMNGKYLYFSIDDVRYFGGYTGKDILIRTAENENDYTGGSNHYSSLENINANALMLSL